MTSQEVPCISCDQPTNALESQKEANASSEPSVIFEAPSLTGVGSSVTVIIEFCDRCRWLHRATWTQTELMLTFPPPALHAITLIPLNSPETSGRFRVWLRSEHGTVLLWDRKTEGGFPELKDLKQRVRDRVDPGRSLGHSDKHPKTT